MDRDDPVGFDRILDRARAGDEHAWAELYDALAPQLLGYLRVRGATDAESVLGDVFLHVARGIHDFEGDSSGFRSWVFVIATSRVLDERRRLRRKPTEPLAEAAAEALRSTDDVQADVEASIAASAAAELLDLLTPDQRAVVALRVFGELTSPEVSLIVGKPVGAVKALYRRGIATLRRELLGDTVPAGPARQLIPSGAVSFGAALTVTERS